MKRISLFITTLLLSASLMAQSGYGLGFKKDRWDINSLKANSITANTLDVDSVTVNETVVVSDTTTVTTVLADSIDTDTLSVNVIIEGSNGTGIQFADSVTFLDDVIINQTAEELFQVVSGNDSILFDPGDATAAIDVIENAVSVFTVNNDGDVQANDIAVGADDDIGNVTIHDAGTITMYDDSDDTSVQIGPVADGTTTLGITGTINPTTITEGGIAVHNNDEMDASSELATIIDDETGTGYIVFNTAPDLVGPVDISSSGSSNGLNIDGNKTTGNLAQFVNDNDGSPGDSSVVISKLGAITEHGIDVPNVDEIDASSELAAIIDDETGSGAIMFATSPTITTGIDIGADDAIAHITIHDAGTIVLNDDSDDTQVTIGPVADGTTTLGITGTVSATALQEGVNAVPNVTDNLSVFAATTSAQLAGVLSDETGTGLAVFATAPDFTGPVDVFNTPTDADTTLGARLINTTAATLGAQKPSPGLTFRGQGWDADNAVSRKVQFNNYVLPVQGNTVSATMYWNYSLENGAYTTPMSLTSGGALTTSGYGYFGGGTIVGNSTYMIYYSAAVNGNLTYSINNWYADYTNWSIGNPTPRDQMIYSLKINYDADSDPTDNTASQFAITPVGNATPASSTIAFTQSVGAGYTFDKNLTLLGTLLTIPYASTINNGSNEIISFTTTSLDLQVGANSQLLLNGEVTMRSTAVDKDIIINPAIDGGANVLLGVQAADTTVVSGPMYAQAVSGTSIGLTSHLYLPLENDATTPTLNFGDDADGIYSSADGALDFATSGTARMQLNDSRLEVDNISDLGNDGVLTIGSTGYLTLDVVGTGNSYVEVIQDNNAGYLAVGRTSATESSVISVTDGGTDNAPGFWQMYNDGGTGYWHWTATDGTYRIANAQPADDDAGGYAIIDADDGTIGATTQPLLGSTLQLSGTATMTTIESSGTDVDVVLDPAGNAAGSRTQIGDASGNDTLVVNGPTYHKARTAAAGGMYFNANAGTQTPVASDTIGIAQMSQGFLDGFTFDAGSTGAYTAVDDDGSGVIRLFDAGHGLVTGDWISVYDGNYNGIYEVTVTHVDSIKITATYGATDAGSWVEPSRLTLTETGLTDVPFEIRWNISASVAGSPAGDQVVWGVYINSSPCVCTFQQRTLSTGSVYGSFGSGSIKQMSTGDDLFMFFLSDDTNALNHKYGSLTVSQR